jgi:hypothetical protein
MDQSNLPSQKDLKPPIAINNRHLSRTRNSPIRNGLLDLSGELRNEIYKEVMGACCLVHIRFDNKRIMSVKCKVQDGQEEGMEEYTPELILDACHRDWYRRGEALNIGIIHLLRTCRTM